jgi:hypothetical protein
VTKPKKKDPPLPTSWGAEADEPVPYRLTVTETSLAGALSVLADAKRAAEEGERRRAAEQPDPVNHPPHYTSSPARCECGRQIECIDVTRHLNFNRGNVIKYVWRAGSKGSEVEDLEKALWYLKDELERVRGAVR